MEHVIVVALVLYILSLVLSVVLYKIGFIGVDIMISLIKKDFKLSFKINLFVIIYALFISAVGVYLNEPLVSNLLYAVSIVVLTFATVIFTNGYDDKNKSEIILNSLPLDRRNIEKQIYNTHILHINVRFGNHIVYKSIDKIKCGRWWRKCEFAKYYCCSEYSFTILYHILSLLF